MKNYLNKENVNTFLSVFYYLRCKKNRLIGKKLFSQEVRNWKYKLSSVIWQFGLHENDAFKDSMDGENF